MRREKIRIDSKGGVDGVKGAGAIARTETFLRANELRFQGLPAVPGIHVQPRCKTSSTDNASPPRQEALFDAGDNDVIRIDHLGEVDFCHL